MAGKLDFARLGDTMQGDTSKVCATITDGAAVTHDEAFLQDIIQYPDDDLPRLVYSDWLEEHGDVAPDWLEDQGTSTSPTMAATGSPKNCPMTSSTG